MSMQLVSEILIKKEIKRLESNPELIKDDLNGAWLCMCKKELAVIERLKINNVDLTGDIDDVIDRLEKQEIYFMDPQKFEAMKEKAKKYNAIERLVKEKEKK